MRSDCELWSWRRTSSVKGSARHRAHQAEVFTFPPRKYLCNAAYSSKGPPDFQLSAETVNFLGIQAVSDSWATYFRQLRSRDRGAFRKRPNYDCPQKLRSNKKANTAKRLRVDTRTSTNIVFYGVEITV